MSPGCGEVLEKEPGLFGSRAWGREPRRLCSPLHSLLAGRTAPCQPATGVRDDGSSAWPPLGSTDGDFHLVARERPCHDTR